MNFTGFANEGYTPAFTYKSVRERFVNKVFSIVGVQLLITALIVITMQSFVTLEVLSNILLLPSAVVATICSLILVFSRDLARKSPHNYILLGVFTVCESILVNSILYMYSLETITKAFFTTALLIAAIGFAAKNADYDMTNSKFFMYAGLFHLVILVFSLFIMRIDHILMAYLGAVMFSAYLYFDLQLLMGDRSKMVTVDDYIFASINIYIDVIQIFIKLVQIFGENDKKEKKKQRR